MNVTAAKHTPSAGLSAVLAGLSYLIIQFIHPEKTVAASA